jgi:hypothetical protein
MIQLAVRSQHANADEKLKREKNYGAFGEMIT